MTSWVCVENKRLASLQIYFRLEQWNNSASETKRQTTCKLKKWTCKENIKIDWIRSIVSGRLHFTSKVDRHLVGFCSLANFFFIANLCNPECLAVTKEHNASSLQNWLHITKRQTWWWWFEGISFTCKHLILWRPDCNKGSLRTMLLHYILQNDRHDDNNLKN